MGHRPWLLQKSFFLFNNYFPATTDIHTLRSRHANDPAPINRVPRIIHLPSSIFHHPYPHLLLAEIHLERADALLAGFRLARSKVAQELEVCTTGADRHRGARIV